ncbi:MAG: YegS/Rv2252/BmrU family lipid kinase [Acidimicrobiales bacterium]|nr:YegS/Rv2252/BmrU family lipid kinase [Acidimicrobiales bacterium]
MRHRVAIWNPASGSAPDEDELKAALGADTELVETSPQDPGAGQAAKAVANGATVVIACGGDGTVRSCLEGLTDSDTSLGIVPLGTGNLLAHNLSITDGMDAANSAGRGDSKRIDLGQINGETFAVMAGSGFDALMIRDASDKVKSRLGTIAYVISGAKNLRTDLVHTTVEVDGKSWFQGRTSMVLVGNFGTITGGIDVFPDAEPDDGLLDVAVMSPTKIREWLTVAWRLFRHKPLPLELARRTHGREILVEHRQPRPYELDGEDRDPTRRLDISVLPDAISIRLPGPTNDEGIS